MYKLLFLSCVSESDDYDEGNESNDSFPNDADMDTDGILIVVPCLPFVLQLQ